MQNCPMGGGMMMIGLALVWLLIVAALLLAIAALVKYLRSGPGQRSSGQGAGEVDAKREA